MNNTPTLSSTERVDDFARHLAAILRRIVTEQNHMQETNPSNIQGSSDATNHH